jgi:hypothetical protein
MSADGVLAQTEIATLLKSIGGSWEAALNKNAASHENEIRNQANNNSASLYK